MLQLKKIAAVVVTYNRLEMLKKCISALENQTYECDVFIINNASTDSTEQWGLEYTSGKDNLFYYNTGENIGGAGGFNYGMRKAVEAGYEYVWVMDDDCIPNADSLEKLMEADETLGGNYGWLSSKCLWTDGNICNMNVQRKTVYKDITDFSQQFINAQMCSFVSLFLKTETIKEFGLPIKEFFIWTDDWEYTRRISKQKPCFVVTDSVVVHRMKQNKPVNIATDSGDRIERYKYFYRNDVYLYRREGIKGWIWLIVKNLWHTVQVIVGREKRIMKIKTIWLGFWQGIHFKPTIEEL